MKEMISDDYSGEVLRYLKMLAGASSTMKSTVLVSVNTDDGIKCANGSIRVVTEGNRMVNNITITLPSRYDGGATIDSILNEAAGAFMHELGHSMFSKCMDSMITESVNDYKYCWKSKKWDDIIDIEKDFMSILEDARVNTKMREYFRQSRSMIRALDDAYIRTDMSERSVDYIRKSMTALWLRTKGVKISRLMDRNKRVNFNKFMKRIISASPETKPSTVSMFKSVEKIFWDNIELFKDLLNDNNEGEPGQPDHSKSSWSESPEFEDTDESNPNSGGAGGDDGNDNEGEGKDGRDKGEGKMGGSGRNHYQSQGCNSDDGDEKLAKVIGKLKIEYPDQNDARPYEVQVKRCAPCTIHTGSNVNISNGAEYYLSGKALGRRLRKKLIFSERDEHRKTSGRLDVNTIRRDISKHGIPTTTRIFKRGFNSKHLHSVGIIIDMSGSMQYSGGGLLRFPIGYNEDVNDNSTSRMQAAKRAACLMSGCLDEMNVGHFISGMSAVDGALRVHEYIFKKMSGKLDMGRFEKSYNNKAVVNRDSESIRLGAKKLLSEGKGKRILFIISDGKPNHPDGVEKDDGRSYNSLYKSDMRRAIYEAKMSGVTVVGIGITNEASSFIADNYEIGLSISEDEVASSLPKALFQAYITIVNPTKR